VAYETYSKAEDTKSVDLSKPSLEHSSDTVEQSMAGISGGSAHGWLGGWRGLLVGLGAGAAIAFTVTHLTTPTQTPSPTPTAATTQSAGQSVSIAPVEMTQVTRVLNVTGSVAAHDLLPVLAQATGLQIQQVLVEEGQTVQAGEVIAILDSSVLQAQLNQAIAQLASAEAVVRQKQATLNQQRASLAEAENNLRRYQALAKDGAITRQELDSRSTTAMTGRESVSVAQANIVSAEADVQGVRAQIQKLQTQIAQTQVRAPDSGIIAEKIARIGDVTGSTKLFTIIRNNSLELQVKVPEPQLPQVKIGALAQISSDADRRIHLQGKVREISPMVDQQTRQAMVKLDLPSNGLLRPGMFLKSALAVQSIQAMTVPAKAILPQTDGRSLVYVLTGTDIVRSRAVDVGSRTNPSEPMNARVEIKSGLNPGDRVVVIGAGYVKDGDRVTIVSQ